MAGKPVKILDVAAKQRHLSLLKKVRNGQALTPGEMRELEQYEAAAAKQAAAVKPGKKKKGPPGKLTVAQVKAWGMTYADIPEAEQKEGLTLSLAAAMSRAKSLANAWQRGQLLQKLRQYGGETGLSIEEVGKELGFETGQLTDLFQRDAEACEVFNNARMRTIIELTGASIQLVRAGKSTPTTAKILAASMKREVAQRGADFEHLTTAQMEELFGVTRITLNDWLTKFGAPRNADKTYNLRVFLPWYTEYTIGKISRQPGKYGPRPEDRISDLRAQKIQTDLDERSGRLWPRSTVIAGLFARVNQLASVIRQRQQDLPVLLQHLPADKIRPVTDAMFETLLEASRTVPREIEELKIATAEMAAIKDLLGRL